MKKLFYLLVLFIFIIPFKVGAVYTTDKYYFDIKINQDGSLLVRELAILEGTYNNRELTIKYRDANLRHFTGVKEDFYESDIYNNAGITDIKVGDVLVDDDFSFDYIDQVNQYYTKSSYVNNGDCGKYVFTEITDGISLKIACSSDYRRAFYVEYKVLNAVVIHNDVAEFYYPILGSDYTENITDFQVKVHLPSDGSTMRFWAHGPLNSSVEKLDEKTIYLKSDFIGAYNPVDVRVIFDKNLVPNSTKKSNVEATHYILEIEEERADEANQQRAEAKLLIGFVKGSTIIWYLGVIAFLIYTYIKYDKERTPNYKYDYYREIPLDYPPELVEYLMKKNVSVLGFKANILSLIERKKIKVEGTPADKNNYRLILVNKENLNELDSIIIELLFEKIGANEGVTLKEIEKYSKNYTNAQTFMNSYNRWLSLAKGNGTKAGLFESHLGFKVLSFILVFLSGVSIFILNVNLGMFSEANISIYSVFLFLLLPLLIFSSIYLIAFKKRTVKGVEDYNIWNAFKRFLLDFGHFSDKELPEIALWEKYLVYATVLGCARQLEKSMKIKLQEMSTTVNNPTLMNYYITSSILNSTISSSVSNAVTTAVSSSRASIARSQSSSGGGFGGGFSGGGFSGGFGGGGGRS